MRGQLSEAEWATIRPMLANKTRGVSSSAGGSDHPEVGRSRRGKGRPILWKAKAG
jgi:hypothetical protein